MTEQQQQPHPQPAPRSTAPGVDSAGLSIGGLSTEDLDTGREELLDRRRADLSRARARLAEVMTDEEQRAFGLNVDLLDDVLNERQ